jgi:HK97 family phage major capsid protein
MEPKTQETAPVGPELQAFIAKTVGEAVAPLVDALQTKATDNMGGGLPVSEGHAPITGKDAADGSGINLARFVKAMAAGHLRHMSPVEIAKGWGYTRVANELATVVKAPMAQGDLTTGGSLVPPQFASEFIDLLKNETVLRRAGIRSVTMGSSLTMPEVTGAPTVYWGEENADITESLVSTGSKSLAEKKETALVRISNDLIRNASISSEELVRNQLVSEVGIAEDLAFLRGSGSSSKPTGLRYQAFSSHIYAETIATPGAPTLAEAKTELNKAKRLLKAANVQMRKGFWVMSARTEAGILDIVGPGGEGSNTLESEMTLRGTLRGLPFYVTQQVPENTGGGSDSELYLIDGEHILIGDSLGMLVDVFPNGGEYGIVRDQTIVRVIKKSDILALQTKAIAVVNDISWQ